MHLLAPACAHATVLMQLLVTLAAADVLPATCMALVLVQMERLEAHFYAGCTPGWCRGQQ